MIRLAPTLSLYISRHFLGHFAILIAVFLGLIYLIDTIELLRRSSTKAIDISTLLYMALLKLPHIGQKTVPFAILFAAMWSFSKLTKSHELVIARAAGVSAWRFMTPVIMTAFMLGALQIGVINPLGSAAQSAFNRLENTLFNFNANQLSLSSTGLWLRQSNDTGQSVIHAKAVQHQEDSVLLNHMSIFIYGADGVFSQRIEAKEATLNTGYWHLKTARTHQAEKPIIFDDELFFDTDLTLTKIQDSFAPPETMSFWSLPSFITTLEKAGFSGKRHKMYLHSLLATPFLLAAMILIAGTFTLRHARKGGTSLVITAGVMSGFVLYFFSDIATALALSGKIPVILAAWAPAGISTLLGSAMILHLEDG